MPSATVHNIRALHDQIRRDIEAERARKHHRERGLAADSSQHILVRPQQDVKDQVGFGCKTMDKLLDELTAQTKTDDLAEAQLLSDNTNGDVPDEGEADLLDEVSTLRALASDDTSLETSSVADYSADPPSAPNFSTTSIVTIVEEMCASQRKMKESLDTISDILHASPHWWTSPIVMRRLKTHSIRVNYHARKCKKWGNQCRAHLFVSSNILNRAGQEATSDLRELRGSVVVYQKRRERLRLKRQRLQNIGDEIAQTGDEMTRLHDHLVPPIIQRAAAVAREVLGLEGPPPTMTVESAESVLLIAGLANVFPEMAPHVPTLVRYYAVESSRGRLGATL
jgi:hypothetical protein